MAQKNTLFSCGIQFGTKYLWEHKQNKCIQKPLRVTQNIAGTWEIIFDGDQGHNKKEQQGSTNDPLYIHGGPMTRAKAKRMKESLNGLIKKEAWANLEESQKQLGQNIINII